LTIGIEALMTGSCEDDELVSSKTSVVEAIVSQPYTQANRIPKKSVRAFLDSSSTIFKPSKSPNRSGRRAPQRFAPPSRAGSSPVAFVKSAFSRLTSRKAVLCKLARSEEHTSELQSPYDLVCRLLLEK